MAMRLTQVPQNSTDQDVSDPIGYETTYDGQTFHWGPNEKRAFGDDGQAIGHVNNAGAGSPAEGVVQDNALSLKQYPNSDSRS